MQVLKIINQFLLSCPYFCPSHNSCELWKLIKGNLIEWHQEARRGALSGPTTRVQLPQTGRDASCISNRTMFSLYYPNKKKKDFLFAWQQLSQWETVTTHPIKILLHFEIPVSSKGLFAYNTLQLPLFLYGRTVPLLYISDFPKVCHSLHVLNCLLFCCSQVNLFLLVK